MRRRAIGGDCHDVQVVNLREFRRFGFRRAGHAGEFRIHAEVVLEGNGGKGLRLILHPHAFLGFHRLMKAVAPAPPRHQTPGELVDDHHLAILNDVISIHLIERVRPQRLLHVVVHLDHRGVVEILDAEQLLHLMDALFGKRHRALLFIDGEIARIALHAGLIGIVDFAFLQKRNDGVRADELVGGAFGRSRDNEWGARFIDEDRIDLIHDGIGVFALDAILQAKLHVVAEVIEAEFVVRAVGNVAAVRFLALPVAQVMNDDAYRHAQKAVNLAHPLRIALGQVIVHRDDVHAFARERVEVDGQRGDKCLAFTGFHFGDLTLVEHHAADQLHVVVAHAEHAPPGFPHRGECLGKQVVEGLPFLETVTEFHGLLLQFGIAELFHGGLKRIDGLNHRLHALDGALIRSAE